MLLSRIFARRGFLSLAASGLLASAGCHNFNMVSMRSQNPEEEDEEEREEELAKANIRMVGDMVSISGLHSLAIENVGLVTRLNKTGGDPSPSIYRTLLLEDMKRRNVPSPNALLESEDTALVIVRAVLPPAIAVGEKVDFEVFVPDNGEAKSLAGGWLLMADLAEQAIVPGRGPLKGHVMGHAAGAVLVSIGTDDEASNAGVLKRGKVLGGCVYTGGILKKDRNLGLVLRTDFRSFRNSKRLADQISRRFNKYNRGHKELLANAQTDQHIELKLHPTYKNNYSRYLDVVRKIVMDETPVQEHARLERLKKQLLVPQTASSTALELEAIGGERAITVLKEGLKSPIAEVRFYSADALAYLGSSLGAADLADAAEKEDAFRVFAFAALTLCDEGETHQLLKRLMHEYSPDVVSDTIQLGSSQRADVIRAQSPTEKIKHGAETRYGAFRALSILNARDNFIRGEPIRQQGADETEPYEFTLHVLNTTGEPMVHLVRSRAAEIVLFGANQKLITPVALSAGSHIVINARASSEKVTVSSFRPGTKDQELVVSTDLADVIRAAGQLGASYPDIAQMLSQADKQGNLPGRFEIDAIPQAGRIYYRPKTDGGAGDAETATVGAAGRAPNIYPSIAPQFRGPLDREGPATTSSADETSSSTESDAPEAAPESDAAPEIEAVQVKESFWNRVMSNPFAKKAPRQAEPE